MNLFIKALGTESCPHLEPRHGGLGPQGEPGETRGPGGPGSCGVGPGTPTHPQRLSSIHGALASRWRRAGATLCRMGWGLLWAAWQGSQEEAEDPREWAGRPSHDGLVRQPVEHRVEGDGEPPGALQLRPERCRPVLPSVRGLVWGERTGTQCGLTSHAGPLSPEPARRRGRCCGPCLPPCPGVDTAEPRANPTHSPASWLPHSHTLTHLLLHARSHTYSHTCSLTHTLMYTHTWLTHALTCSLTSVYCLAAASLALWTVGF